MKAKLEIKMNNDAFKQNPLELARIFRNLADDIEYINGPNLGTFIGIADINGNTVGSLEVVGDNNDSEQSYLDGDENYGATYEQTYGE